MLNNWCVVSEELWSSHASMFRPIRIRLDAKKKHTFVRVRLPRPSHQPTDPTSQTVMSNSCGINANHTVGLRYLLKRVILASRLDLLVVQKAEFLQVLSCIDLLKV